MKATCKKTCGICDPNRDNTKFCFSLDPIEWYDSCSPMLWEAAQDVMDSARVCEYDHQIQVVSNPNIWDGKMKPFTAYTIAGHGELDCAAVIQDGSKFYDDQSFHDSMDLPLGPCCGRVHEFFTCMGKKQEELVKDGKGLQFLDQSTYSVLGAFSSYCVPLFKYPTKSAFCAEFPKADPCVEYHSCEHCTSHGGIWCNNKQQCNIKTKETCDTNHQKPAECASAKARKRKKKTTTTTTTTTTTPPGTTTTVERKDHYWWEMVHSGNFYASTYIPDPNIGLRTDSPAFFDAYH